MLPHPVTVTLSPIHRRWLCLPERHTIGDAFTPWAQAPTTSRTLFWPFLEDLLFLLFILSLDPKSKITEIGSS